jgi:DNA-binding MarR family transcriptional regulator
MHTYGTNPLSALALMIGDTGNAAVRAATELSPQEIAALVLVRNRSGCSVNWLHHRLGLTQSGAVRLLDRLQQDGLITRNRTPGRREVSLAITPSGEAVVERGVRARSQAIESLLDGLPAADSDQLMNLIERVLSLRGLPRDDGDAACRLCDWPACIPDCPVDGTDRGDSQAATRTPDRPHPGRQ